MVETGSVAPTIAAASWVGALKKVSTMSSLKAQSLKATPRMTAMKKIRLIPSRMGS